MAEVLVSALVNTILDNLNSLPLEEMGLAGSLKTEVENLESSLSTIRAVLHDAEMKQWKSEAIKNWLAKLKQAAYHLEDVLHDFNTEALRCRRKVTTFFSLRNPLLFRLNMARKLKNVREKLDAISGEKSKFHLREGAGEAEIEPREDRQTSSVVEESEVIGRADDKEKIITSIMRQESFVIEPKERLKIPKTARHLFVHDNRSPTNIMDLTKLPSLQSLILENSGVNLSNPSRFISKQKYMKVLDFGYNFSNIAFGSLKHLRYLRLCHCNLKTLPESTSSLHNLQTLNLKSCHSLQMLPKGMKHLKNLRYLDIKGCYELTCMPAGLGQLSCLRKLSQFIVGKDNGCGIDELKDLALEGELSIIGLCNVKSSTEAKNANLIKKQNLRSLSLSWRVNAKEKSHHQHGNDEDILSGLQPHSSLKKLCIIEYQGISFTNWMMDLLVPNLVEISLENCERCHQLPPLGKLRFLKALTIVRMDALKYIDNNLYGDTESSFPSLEVLKILIAPCLVEWTTANGGQHFPLLSSLTIRYCPKLVKLPMLQSLKELQIEGTNVGLLQSLMMSATLLTSLQLGNAHEPTDLPDGLLQHQTQLDKLSIVSTTLKSAPDVPDNLNTLKHLDFQCCVQLESLPQGLENLSSLETLGLSQCDSFVSLPAYGFRGLSSLTRLEIKNCKKLASLSEGVRYLTSLRDLIISNCTELTSLPQSIQCLSSLRFLGIYLCQRLASLPNEIQHLALLSELEIYDCSNLMSLPRGMRSLSALQTLRIKGCPRLEKRCKKHRGEDWPNIAHIPSIQILRKAW
ncbi:hypothetical protein V6N13_107136 [Hibiscus sabdariffa]